MKKQILSGKARTIAAVLLLLLSSEVRASEAKDSWRGLGSGHSVSLGLSRVNDIFSEPGQGQREGVQGSQVAGASTLRWSVGYSYMPNPFFGAQFAVAFARVEDWEREYARPWSDSLLPTAGLLLSPLHMNWFGYNLLRVGVQGGLMGLMETPDPGSAAGAAAVPTRQVSPYYGLHLAYSLWDWASVTADARRVAGSKGDRTMLSLALAIGF